jgi:hypothetical protein
MSQGGVARSIYSVRLNIVYFLRSGNTRDWILTPGLKSRQCKVIGGFYLVDPAPNPRFRSGTRREANKPARKEQKNVGQKDEKEEKGGDEASQEAPSLGRGCLVNAVFSACVGIGLLMAYKGAFSDWEGIYFPIGLALLGIGSVVIWREWK